MAQRDLKVGIGAIQAAVRGSHTFPEFKQMHVPFFLKLPFVIATYILTL